MKRWYTCAPRRFGGGESFFCRDSGVLCRGLQRMGYESKAILLGPPQEGDLPDIIRADLQDMQSVQWWSNLKLDGVIMVAWASHDDTPISRAIAASGTRLVLHIDGSNTGYPLFCKVEALKTFWRMEHDVGSGLLRRCGSFLNVAVLGGLKTLIKHSYLKYRHLRYVNVVTCQTPTAVEGLLRLCSFYGGKAHGVKVRLAGSPVPENFNWSSALRKQKRIIAVGRWDDLRQKRPFVLMAVCEAIARRHSDLGIDIFGKKTEALVNWHQALEPEIRKNIHLHGLQPAETVARAVQMAQISFFPSSYEGGPLSLFEGLSCGTTTVSLDSPNLPGGRWAAQHHHADLAARDTTEAYVEALERGLQKWESGEYCAQAISEFWTPKTRLDLVLKIMIDAASESGEQGGTR